MGMALQRLQGMMRKMWGLDMQHLYHIHFSPDCSTYSTANHTHTRRNADGTTTTIHAYRNEDGTGTDTHAKESATTGLSTAGRDTEHADDSEGVSRLVADDREPSGIPSPAAMYTRTAGGQWGLETVDR